MPGEQQASLPAMVATGEVLSVAPRGTENREITRLLVVWPLGHTAGWSIWLTGLKTSNWLEHGGQ
jgi:hypothetical protein